MFQSGMAINPHPEVVQLLQKNNMWGGAGSTFQKRLQRVLGAGIRYDVRKIFDQYYVRLSNELPQKFLSDGFKASMVLAYHDTPGRICAFRFLGGKPKEDYLKVLNGPGTDDDEGGLAMLDLLDAYEKTVIAVEDPRLALQLHRRRFMEFDQPLKIISYNHQTKCAWRSINADRVIFWHNEPTVRLFEQVRRVANGYICLKHWYYTTSGALSRMAYNPLALLTAEIERSAKPWPEVFVQWITDPDRTETEAKYAFEQLNFTPGEKDLIVSAATELERFKIETFMGAQHRPRTVSIGVYNVVEHNGTWALAKHSGETIITDAVIELSEELSDPDRGESYLKGSVLYRGKRLEFTEPTLWLRKNIIEWLSRLTNKAGLGSPRVCMNRAHNLVDIARAFSTPRVRVISTRLGLQENGAIVFPRFNLVGGKVVDPSFLLTDPTVPMAALQPPSRRKADQRDTVSPTRSALIATVSAFLANWLMRADGAGRSPIAVVGGPGSVANIAINHLTMGLGLCRHSPLTITTSDLATLIRQADKHNCPSYIDGTNAKVCPVSGQRNVLLGVTPLICSTLRISEHPWLTINATELRRDKNPLPPVDDIIWYIADLQERGYQLPIAPQDVHKIVVDMCSWYERYLDRDQTETRQQALSMLQVTDLPGNELVRFAAHMITDGYMWASHGRLANRHLDKGVGVVIDDDANTAFISKLAVIAAVSRLRLPAPDLGAANQDLADRGLLLETPFSADGWLLPLTHFNDQIRPLNDPKITP